MSAMTEQKAARPFPRQPKIRPQHRSNAEVRRKIYADVAWRERVRQYHVKSWELDSGHPENCDVCKRMNTEITGLRGLIRAFGGKPRF